MSIRLLDAKVTSNISVVLDNRFVDVSQKPFLKISKNKQKLINLLSDELELSGNIVVQCTGNADTAIVSKGLDYTCAGNNVKLMGADIDLLIILLYFWNSEMAEMKMLSEPTMKTLYAMSVGSEKVFQT